jgi:transposase
MTARYRPYDPNEGYFTLIDPNDIKNHNLLLKAIDSFVEEHISVEPFSESVKNEVERAPVVHPRMMLKVIFYSYAKGVYSSWEMEDRMRWDPNYTYLSASQRVDHSTICNFILKYGEEIKAVFSQLVYVMANTGYITMDFVAIDGTKIRANAGLKFTGNVQEFRQQRDRIVQKIEKIMHHTMDEESDGKTREEKLWQGDLIRGRDCRMEIDGDTKRLTCPSGQVMEPLIAKEDRGSYFYRFRPEAVKCKGCKFRARCYRNNGTYRDFRIKKEYFETLSLRTRMTEKLSSEWGKKMMRGRSCLIEHVFGEIKEIFRFRRLAYRGLEKVRVIWQLVCIGYNLRKMTRLAYG